MKITCETIDDILIHIKETPVHLNTVFVNKTIMSATSDPVRTASKVTIGMQVSAVLCFEDDSQALIEAGESLGNDYRTADSGNEGSAAFDSQMQKLYDVCNERGLRIRPGLLGL